MRYCGYFLIKAEGGAKNYKRDHPLPLSWPPFTVILATLYRRFRATKGTFNYSLSYTYIYVLRYLYHNSSVCHAYVMWAEIGHCHFLYVPAVSNVVTTGNSTVTMNVLNGTVRLGLSLESIQSSVYGTTTVAKVSLFSTRTRLL